MRSPAVVEVQVSADRTAGLADAFVGLQIHLLIFDAAPQPLDEDIVPPSPLAVDAETPLIGLCRFPGPALPPLLFVCRPRQREGSEPRPQRSGLSLRKISEYAILGLTSGI
jgi:hypothetical protein